MGLFDLFKKESDGTFCPYCDAKDVSPATAESMKESEKHTEGHGKKYVCNYCGKVFVVKHRR